MTAPATHTIPQDRYFVLREDDYTRITPEMFGSEGVHATEVIGPFVEIQASGPLLMVHDGLIEPHLGIGHHPHRHNERIFYLETGQLDHDDQLNGITGHINAGEVGLFTEGKRGMVHSEWNNGDVPTHAYILVYNTDPVPDDTFLTVLKDADAPRYEEAPGVRTKEMVGPGSPLEVHGDIRLFTENWIEAGAELAMAMDDNEGGLLAVREGTVAVDGQAAGPGETILAPPAEGPRTLVVRANEAARVLRTVYGPGFGFVQGQRRQG